MKTPLASWSLRATLCTSAFLLLPSHVLAQAPASLAWGRGDSLPWQLETQDPTIIVSYGPGVDPPPATRATRANLFSAACDVLSRRQRGVSVQWRLDLEDIAGSPVLVDSNTVIVWRWRYNENRDSDAATLSCRFNAPHSNVTRCFATHGSPHSVCGVLGDPTREWRMHSKRIEPPDRTTTHGLVPLELTSICIAVAYPVNQIVEIDSLYIGPGEAESETTAATRPPGLIPTGSGCLEDFDGDGWLDFLVISSSGRNSRLLLAEQGGHLLDTRRIHELPGVSGMTGILPIDIDGDADLDLITTRVGQRPTIVHYENRGNLRYMRKRVPAAAMFDSYGLCASRHPAIGGLAVYPFYVRFNKKPGGPDEIIVLAATDDEPPLLLSEAWQEQVVHGGKIFGACAADLDGDGFPDIVAAGYQPGVFVLPGSPDGFTGMPIELHRGRAGGEIEGVAPGDYDADGDLDLFVCVDRNQDEQGERPGFLFRNDGELQFVDVAHEAGFVEVTNTEAAVWGDFDNDGWLDLYLGNRWSPSRLYRNDGGSSFTVNHEILDPYDGPVDGVLSGDIDRDGDLDVLVLRGGEYPRILWNGLGARNGFAVEVRGRPGRTHALDARVSIRDPESRRLGYVQHVLGGRGFGPSGPRELHFGMGDQDVVEVVVEFPSGAVIQRTVRRGDTGPLVVFEPSDGVIASIWSWWRVRALPDLRSRSFRRPSVLLAAVLLLTVLIGISAAMWRQLLAMWLGLVVVIVIVHWQLLAPGAHPALLLRLWAQPVIFGTSMVLFDRVTRPRKFIGSPDELLENWGKIGHSSMIDILNRSHRRLFTLLAPDTPDPARIPFAKLVRHSLYACAALDRVIGRILELSDHILPEQRPAIRRLQRAHRRFGVLLRALPSDDTWLLQASGAQVTSFRQLARYVIRNWRSLSPVRIGDLLQTYSRHKRLVDFKGLLRRMRLDFDILEAGIKSRYATSLDAVVDRYWPHWMASATEAGVELVLDRDPAAGESTAFIDEIDLGMALDCLFQNGIEAIRGCQVRRLTIRMRFSRRFHELDIVDTGPGVRADLAETIFEQGFSTRGDGRGEGLPRSRRDLRQFGGDLTLVESSAGATRFRISLKALEQSPASALGERGG